MERIAESHIFAPLFNRKHLKFGLWCNGSTTGFGSVCPGSKFLANAGVFVCIGAESSLPLHFDTLTWPMRENRLFRPSARLAPKNGSGNP
ncbi:hypothetical protein [uncultured Bacteroides sp.]|uniref:hypothetical protein n=1 Tax=uncultured Bacteroides sp. TaxID=162156 RepID=UPI00261B9CF7|nr:hypothetical protein [uncultured Bacteroides sp.]